MHFNGSKLNTCCFSILTPKRFDQLLATSSIGYSFSGGHWQSYIVMDMGVFSVFALSEIKFHYCYCYYYYYCQRGPQGPRYPFIITCTLQFSSDQHNVFGIPHENCFKHSSLILLICRDKSAPQRHLKKITQRAKNRPHRPCSLPVPLLSLLLTAKWYFTWGKRARFPGLCTKRCLTGLQSQQGIFLCNFCSNI